MNWGNGSKLPLYFSLSVVYKKRRVKHTTSPKKPSKYLILTKAQKARHKAHRRQDGHINTK
jgi:hypothetical protein